MKGRLTIETSPARGIRLYYNGEPVKADALKQLSLEITEMQAQTGLGIFTRAVPVTFWKESGSKVFEFGPITTGMSASEIAKIIRQRIKQVREWSSQSSTYTLDLDEL